MPPRRKPVQKRVAQKADDGQKQAQQQNVVVNIGHRATTARRRVAAKRKAAPKKRAPAKRPAAQQQAGGLAPVIVPFTRVPPIWIQQPEPVRPFASNEPAVPVSLARQIAADKAEERMKMNPSVGEMAIQTESTRPTTSEVGIQVRPHTSEMGMQAEPPRPSLAEMAIQTESHKPSIAEMAVQVEPPRPSIAEMAIQTEPPRPALVEEISSQPSVMTAISSRKKAAPAKISEVYPEEKVVQEVNPMESLGGGFAKAAPSVQAPPTMAAIVKSAETAAQPFVSPLKAARATPESERTDAQRELIAKADRKNEYEKAQRALSAVGRGGQVRRRVRQIETGELMRSKSTEY